MSYQIGSPRRSPLDPDEIARLRDAIAEARASLDAGDLDSEDLPDLAWMADNVDRIADALARDANA